VERYEIVIQPLSAFGTLLKGDTLFGHFCWQAAYDSALLEGNLERWVSVYDRQPFAVFSSAFPRIKREVVTYYFKRPDIPFAMFGKAPDNRNERIRSVARIKEKTWVAVGGDLKLDLMRAELLTDAELYWKISQNDTGSETLKDAGKYLGSVRTVFAQPHNSINRLSATTGAGGMFAPYVKENTFYCSECELVIIILFDLEATDIERVVTGLKRIGSWGYGRDASTGMGRFRVTEYNRLDLPDATDSDACYTVAPSVPGRNRYERIFFRPFVRFGKHGDRLATSKNPFKNPVIMADEGAVVIPNNREIFQRPYFGTPVTGVSQVNPETIVQGYTPYLPVTLEPKNESRL